MSATNATNSLFSTCTSHRRMAQIKDEEWDLDSPTLAIRLLNLKDNNMECLMTHSQISNKKAEKMPLSNLL